MVWHIVLCLQNNQEESLMQKSPDRLPDFHTKAGFYLKEITLNGSLGRQTKPKLESPKKIKQSHSTAGYPDSNIYRKTGSLSQIPSKRSVKPSRNLDINIEKLRKMFPFAQDKSFLSSLSKLQTDPSKVEKRPSESLVLLPTIGSYYPKGAKKDSFQSNSMQSGTPKIGDMSKVRGGVFQSQVHNDKDAYSHSQAGMMGSKRKTNQDHPVMGFGLPHSVNIIGVCDGHGLNGHFVSSFISEKLMINMKEALEKSKQPVNIRELGEKVYISTNNQLIRSSGINVNLSGSTVVTVLAHNHKLYCFNVGDSRIILVSKIAGKWSCKSLSVDQKPCRPDQRERIVEFGGRVEAQRDENNRPIGPLRVWMSKQQIPGLAMTRAFGDTVGVRAGVIGTPELMQHQLKGNQCFLAAASDGVWEYLSNQEVMQMLVPFYQKNNLQSGCEQVVKKSMALWKKYCMSRDDITVVASSIDRMCPQVGDQR